MLLLTRRSQLVPLYLVVFSVYHLALPATAKYSIIANSETGKPRSRCLPEEHKPILPDVSLLDVVLEENDWATHYLVTAIAGIIIAEHLGHPLTFNVPEELGRVYDRAAMPTIRIGKKKWKDIVSFQPSDGSQLKKMLDDDIHFAYANLEVWTATKQDDIQKFVDALGAVRQVGSIGYPAREGWYIPKWVVDWCGALAYPSWMPGRDQQIIEAFGGAGETTTVAASKDKVKMCYKTVSTSDCEEWAKDPEETDPQVVVHAVKGYGGTFQEAFILNNNMNVVLKFYKEYGEQMQYVKQSLADVKQTSVCGDGGAVTKAVAFYHWEPSNGLKLNEWDQLERVVLPGRMCGQKPDSDGLYDWRCDFESERLTKIRSVQIASRAPLIDQFLRKLQIKLADITQMFKSLEEASDGSDAQITHKEIFTVACAWVKNNEQTWTKWTDTRDEPIAVPFFAFAWDPTVFFVTFICIMVASIFWCLCLDGLFISGRGLREKWNWKIDFVPRLAPRCRKAQGQNSEQVNESRRSTKELIRQARGVVNFAAPVFYDVNNGDRNKVSVALLRIGDCSSEAEVQIETAGGTAVAGESFNSLKSTIRFKPTEQVKWVDIDRMKDRGWKNEEFFRLIITQVVSGQIVIGSLRSCSCVVTDDRAYPGLKERANLDTPRGRRLFVIAILKDFLLSHGEKDEFLRLLWIFYEAFYSSVVSNLLYGVFLLDVIILGRDYYGFFILVVVELINIFLERLSGSHQFRVGTGDLRTELHLFCSRKLVMPFFLNYDCDVDYHFVNCHVNATDAGANGLYGSIYKIYKSLLQLIMAISLNFAMSLGGEGSHPLLQVYKFVPLGIMIPVCIVFGYYWHRDWRWKHQCVHEKSKEGRLKMAFWLLKARKTAKMYGRGFMTDAYDSDFKKAVQTEFKHAKQEAMHEMDSKWLSTNFADLMIVGLWVTLSMVLIESRSFGAGNFSLGGLFTTIGIYKMLKSATLSLCDSSQSIEDAVAMMQTTRDFLEDECVVTKFASLQEKRMKEFGVGDRPLINGDWPEILSCSFQDVIAKNATGHKFHLNGTIPLGKLYCIDTDCPRVEIEVLMGVWQTTILPESGALVLPPFIRVVALSGAKLPELFFRTAIENALIFADRTRYSEEHARSLLTQLNVFGESTAGNGEGLLDQVLEPSETSPDDIMLITLAQVILADPEIIVTDRALLYVPSKLYPRVVSALVAWQKGGPQAVLSLASGSMPQIIDAQSSPRGVALDEDKEARDSDAGPCCGLRGAGSNVKTVKPLQKSDQADAIARHLFDDQCFTGSLYGCPKWLDSHGKIKRTLVLNEKRDGGLEAVIRRYAVPETLSFSRGHLSVQSPSEKPSPRGPRDRSYHDPNMIISDHDSAEKLAYFEIRESHTRESAVTVTDVYRESLSHRCCNQEPTCHWL